MRWEGNSADPDEVAVCNSTVSGALTVKYLQTVQTLRKM